MPKNNIASPAQTIKVLSAYGLSLEKQYGQNFLVDNNILKKILNVSDLSPSETILEIGGGIGTLSLPLCENAHFVHVIELDRDFLPALQGTLNNLKNFKIHNIDAMDLNCSGLKPRPSKIVSNLPYNIAAPLIIKILKECPYVTDFYLMVQKEMADRFTATPNSSNYNALSVKIQLLSSVKKLFDISPNSFLPKPKVGSAFIKIVRNNLDFVHKDLLMGIINDGFHYRRKKMFKALAISERYDERLLMKAFELSGISTGKRAQELSKEDFVRLTKNYSQLANIR